MPSSYLWRTVGLLLFSSLSLHAAPPRDPEAIATLVGQPTSLVASPASVRMTGPLAMQQLVISALYADGTTRDLTPVTAIRIETPNIAILHPGGFLRPQQDGTTAIIAEIGGKSVRIPLVVEKVAEPQPISFRHQVIAGLNVGGCNTGACHGTPSGKNGFKLSLRGFDPPADYTQLTRDVLGRRTDRLDPMASLLLQKGLGRVPHEGGARFGSGGVAVEMISGWLNQGSPDDPTTLPALQKIEVLPGSRILHAPAKWQQLAVMGHFADGSVRDVTRLTVFSSSDSAIGDCNPNGLVEFQQAGEIAILCRYLDEMQSVRLTYLEPREGFVWNNPPAVNYVDTHTFNKLKLMSIVPSDTCSDVEYIRRVTLDLCGMLPTPTEVTAFLTDASPDKRAKLVDQLLMRPEYANFWTLKWSDVLRSNRKTIQLKGVHSFQDWLRDNVAQNTPFDQIVREILTASGHSFSNPPANYFRIARDPQNLAETTAQLFFGIRMQCAKCHNHPFERWTQDDYYSFSAWFARVKQRKDTSEGPNLPNAAEIIFSDRGGDVTQPRTGKTMAPKFLGGATPTIAPNQDRREVLADWLASGQNPFFAKSTVNRVWYHLMGKGIVDPVDDFRDSNPSANDELLDALAKDFIDHHYDMKHLIRTILVSRTYQLSAEPNATNKDDAKYFSHAVTKLLSAEQLLDALCDVTAVPEKFAGLPAGTRAIQLPDGEVNHPFLKTFGQPARELACECERESDSNLSQALQLINGPTINEKIRNPNNRIGKLFAEKKSDTDMLNELYLATLSRPPQEKEKIAALNHIQKTMDKRRAWEDVMWALLNTREFLFRH